MKNVFSLSVLLVQLLTLVKWADSYEIPDVRIQALDPKGLSVSVPDAPGVTAVEFTGTVNNVLYQAEQSRSSNGQWTMTVPDLTLNDGDVVSYNVYVTVNDDDTYFKDGLSYTVLGKQRAEEVPPPTTTTTRRPTTETYYVPPPPTPVATTPTPTVPPTTECPRSVTTIRGQNVCAGEVIFDDRFNKLDENVWRIEHKIPTDHPEFPFVTYQRTQVRVLRIRGQSQLMIDPRPQTLMPNFNREMLYKGIHMGKDCTGRADAPEQCEFTADGPDIVRPIASGRITTKTFAFKYGKVEVVAKLPQGDWLYPELLLEEASLWSQFNGFMKITSARGNRNIQDTVGTEFGNEVLYAGVAYNPNCGEREFQQVNKTHRSANAFFAAERKSWPDDFHTYTLVWKPTGISFMVDGEMVGPELKPPFQGAQCDPRKRFTDSMLPFDRDYKLSFGVAAGGVWVFQDDLISLPDDQHLWNKPWKNLERKAMLKFFRAQKFWHETWEDPKLHIRSVRVIAL